MGEQQKRVRVILSKKFVTIFIKQVFTLLFMKCLSFCHVVIFPQIFISGVPILIWMLSKLIYSLDWLRRQPQNEDNLKNEMKMT